MPQQSSPYLDIKYGWDYGENGWNSGMDENLLKFSYLFNRNINSIVSSLPPAVNGEAYYLTTDKRIYFAVGSIWYSTPVPKWFTVFIKSDGKTYQFDGTNLGEVATVAELTNSVTNINTQISSLGSAAYQDTSSFASPASVSAAISTSNLYTDGKALALQTEIDALTTVVSNKQPLDSTLTGLASVSTSGNTLIYATGLDSFTTTPLTPYARTILSTTDAASLRSNLGTTALVQTVPLATTSGASVDLTGIPVGTKRVTIIFDRVTCSTASVIILQLGSGAPVTSGYVGSATRFGASSLASSMYTIGFAIPNASASDSTSGGVVLFLSQNNTWICSGSLSSTVNTGNFTYITGGTVGLSGSLDRVRVTTQSGVTNFTAGTVNMIYEG